MRDTIRELLVDLKNSEKIWDFFEIEPGHGWYKENQIQFGVHIDENSYDYDCSIEVIYLKDEEKFEFYSRAHVYVYDKLPLVDLTDLKEYLLTYFD